MSENKKTFYKKNQQYYTNTITDYKFSVFIPTYYKEKAENLKVALDSVINQTLIPNEILIIEDGSLTKELDNVIEYYQKNFSNLINIIKLEKNIGIGKVRALGIEKSKYELIAFMDSDDISRKDRFEKQIDFMKKNPNIDVIGSFITEFDKNPEDIYAQRILPTTHNEIYNWGKFRMPVNNNTVLLKKSSVIEAGSYQMSDACEDYELFGRMLYKGYKFANIPEPLVNMRAGSEMMKRRKGIGYSVAHELPCMNKFKEIGYINTIEYLRNIFLKFLLRVIPNWLRNFIYIEFLRKKIK